MGGALTILGALRVQSLQGAICFSPLPPVEAGNISNITMPLPGRFASEDFWCTPAVVSACEATFELGKKNDEFFTYQAQHALINEQRSEVSTAQASDLAWQRCLAFCRKYLAS